MLIIKKIWLCSMVLCAITLLNGCGGDSSGGGRHSVFDASSSSSDANANTDGASPAGNYQPAMANSAYASVLMGCVKNSETEAPCTLGELPFIGQNHSLPTKADILAQTVVSHAWMAQRFSDLLDQMPSDMYLLFRGVTAVVIAHDVRPSYYQPNTGAIYLDPAGLWLTANERATIDKGQDFRSDFGRALQFLEYWAYAKNGGYAWDDYGLDSTVASRPLSDSLGPMMALLFHELAHANDFMPPSALGSVNPKLTPWQQISLLGVGSASNYLTASMPLNSQILKDLGQVLYHGVTPTKMQTQISASDVGAYFAADGANDNYAYSTQYEDTAMLFEETMMRFHYGTDRIEAFLDLPAALNPSCKDYVVRWGQANRVAVPGVKARAQLIAGRILGKDDTSIYFNNLPVPKGLTPGVDWCTNLTQTGAASAGKLQQKLQKANQHKPILRPMEWRRPLVIK